VPDPQLPTPPDNPEESPDASLGLHGEDQLDMAESEDSTASSHET